MTATTTAAAITARDFFTTYLGAFAAETAADGDARTVNLTADPATAADLAAAVADLAAEGHRAQVVTRGATAHVILGEVADVAELLTDARLGAAEYRRGAYRQVVTLDRVAGNYEVTAVGLHHLGRDTRVEGVRTVNTLGLAAARERANGYHAHLVATGWVRVA